MAQEPTATGRSDHGHVLEVHLGSVDELFNSIDPAPFRDRDLDPKAEEFIVGWARELHGEQPFTLRVLLDRVEQGTSVEDLQEAVPRFFNEQAQVTRRRLRLLIRVGRTSLLIGLLALAASIVIGDLLAGALSGTRFGGVVRESFLIGGWVAMWRPLEVFLYDWWPIRAEARLFDRLAAMTVQVIPHQHRRQDADRPA